MGVGKLFWIKIDTLLKRRAVVCGFYSLLQQKMRNKLSMSIVRPPGQVQRRGSPYRSEEFRSGDRLGLD